MTTTSSTRISTTNPVRSDLGTTTGPATTGRRRVGRPPAWALSGVVAGLSVIGVGVSSSLVSAIYQQDIQRDPEAVLTRLHAQLPAIGTFHVLSTVCALALAVFGLGLARRLRHGLPTDSLLPGVAAFGILGTAVIQMMGNALDTEFIAGITQPEVLVPTTAVVYNHWVATVPWCLGLVGLSGLAVFQAAREGAVPRWIGRLGLVTGGLAVLSALAPVQYAAILPAGVFVLVASIGFSFGDTAHRNR